MKNFRIKNAQEQFRMEFKQKDERKSLAICFGLFRGRDLMCLLISMFGNAGAKKQERELQTTVCEIMANIENEDFDAAYVKAIRFIGMTVGHPKVKINGTQLEKK